VKIHFDDSKLHHVAAKCGVFAETDIVNLVKSGIPAEEILCSLADAIVLQNLSRADARLDAEAQGDACSAGPTRTCPSSGVLAPAHPRDVGRARLRLAEGPPIEELIFVPENAQYYAAFGACVYGLKEAARWASTGPRRASSST
jgi:activator of 2-hydroxyglutaryl-CoA dehydratase